MCFTIETKIIKRDLSQVTEKIKYKYKHFFFI